jgi:hypothetical protein
MYNKVKRRRKSTIEYLNRDAAVIVFVLEVKQVQDVKSQAERLCLRCLKLPPWMMLSTSLTLRRRSFSFCMRISA